MIGRFFARFARKPENEAAEWVFRIQDGLAPEEKLEFKRWLEKDRRHPAILSEMQAASAFLDRAVAGEAPPLAKSSGGRRWRTLTIALAAAAAALVVIHWRQSVAESRPFSESVVTYVGELRRLKMPDGSIVDINTDSAISVGYTKDERRMKLVRGEAFFSVAKNAARPFWVEAGGVSLRAIGTAFNVRYHGNTVEVLVAAGKVWVDTGTSPPRLPASTILLAGQKISIPLQAQGLALSGPSPAKTANVEPRAIENALAWQNQRLSFSDTPLSEVIAEFNRYNRHKLVIADPELAEERFGGSFRPNATDALIEILEQNFNLVAEEHGDQTILRRKQK